MVVTRQRHLRFASQLTTNTSPIVEIAILEPFDPTTLDKVPINRIEIGIDAIAMIGTESKFWINSETIISDLNDLHDLLAGIEVEVVAIETTIDVVIEDTSKFHLRKYCAAQLTDKMCNKGETVDQKSFEKHFIITKF